MKKYAKLTPQGSRDFLFEECDDRKKAESVLSALYKEKSYRKVITPTVEYMDVFDDGDSGMDSDIMYKLSDSAGRTTVLRPDNTMPIARLVATRLSADDFPVRLYYNQNVFVRNKALAGRTDEIPQSGIELIGDGSFDADIEVLTMAAEALKRSQLNSFSFEIGHAGFFKAVLSKMNITSAQRSEICRLTEGKTTLRSAICSIPLRTPQKPACFAGFRAFSELQRCLKRRKSFTALPNPIKRLNILKPFMISFALSASAIILLLIWGL